MSKTPTLGKRREDGFQSAVEDLLQWHGFRPRTPDSIAAGRPRRGWYLHIYRAQKNPLLLDVVCLHNDGYYWECELKVPGGKVSPVQRRILLANPENTGLAYTMEEFSRLFCQWLAKCEQRTAKGGLM